jgi:hypothetical protein
MGKAVISEQTNAPAELISTGGASCNCREAFPYWPNLCWYSTEFMKALTISASM